MKLNNKLSLSRVILLDSIDSSISSVYGRKITEEKHQKQIYRYTDTRPNSMNNEMICILCMKRHISVFFYRIFFSNAFQFCSEAVHVRRFVFLFLSILTQFEAITLTVSFA